jgi:hypothetical protein
MKQSKENQAQQQLQLNADNAIVTEVIETDKM